MQPVNTFKAFLKLLGRIINAFTLWERIVVLLLSGVFIASLFQLTIPYLLTFSGNTKGLYTEGLVGQMNLLNPLFADFNDVDRDIASVLFSGLVRYEPQTQNFVPDLATFQRSKDNKTYLFSLKENLLWHDGKPITADDVYFTFHDVIQDPGFKNIPLQQALRDIEIKKIDSRSLSFTLPTVNSFFISYLTTGILPAHLLQGTPIATLSSHPFNKKPIGSGPYRFRKSSPPIYEGQKQITLEAFEGYYGIQPRIPRLRFFLFSDYQTMIENHSTLNGIPKLRGAFISEIPQERFALFTYKLPQSMSVFFNLERPLIGKKHIRQALMKAADKDTIVLAAGSAERIDRLYFSQAPNEWIHQYNAVDANKILDDLGWKLQADGFRHNNKDEILALQLFSKRFLDGSPIEEETKLVIDMLRSAWQTIGIRIDVERQSGDNFIEILQKREYDLFLTGQSLGYNFDTYAFWHSTQHGENGLNFSELQSFRIDSAVEDLRLTFDSNKKQQKMRQLEDLISQEIPALFLYQPIYTYAIDKRIHGFESQSFAFTSDRFAQFSNLTIGGN